MDHRLSRILSSDAGAHRGLAGVLRLVAQDGPLVMVLGAVVLFMAAGAWRSVAARRGVTAAGFTALLALAAAQLIAMAWDRPRPYEAHADVHLLLAPSPDPSFPSDHATGAYAIAFAIALRHRRAGVAALVLATLISGARVALGTHYPTDVLGGALLGYLAALAMSVRPAGAALDRLADAVGRIYDGALARLRRSRPTPIRPAAR